MTERNPASWMNHGAHSAENDRLTMRGLSQRLGCWGQYDLKVVPDGTLGVSINGGGAFVPGTSTFLQGMYSVYNDNDKHLAISSNASGNPRKDIIVAKVVDEDYVGGSTSAFQLVVVTGTPSGSPVEPSLPVSSLKLATITVASGETEIDGSMIVDKRKIAPSFSIIDNLFQVPADPFEGQEVYDLNTGAKYRWDPINGWLDQSHVPHGNSIVVTGPGSAESITNGDTGHYVGFHSFLGITPTPTEITIRKYRPDTKFMVDGHITYRVFGGELFFCAIAFALYNIDTAVDVVTGSPLAAAHHFNGNPGCLGGSVVRQVADPPGLYKLTLMAYVSQDYAFHDSGHIHSFRVMEMMP